MLTSHQIRAARALVRWSARELAEKAGLSLPTIQRMEAADGVPRALGETLMSVQRALEDAGVMFVENGASSPNGGVGVRFRNEVVRARTGTMRAGDSLATFVDHLKDGE